MSLFSIASIIGCAACVNIGFCIYMICNSFEDSSEQRTSSRTDPRINSENELSNEFDSSYEAIRSEDTRNEDMGRENTRNDIESIGFDNEENSDNLHDDHAIDVMNFIDGNRNENSINADIFMSVKDGYF